VKAISSAITMAATFIENRAGEQIAEHLGNSLDLTRFQRNRIAAQA
jgi:hypothetical protein